EAEPFYKVLRELEAKKPEFLVCLYQGNVEEARKFANTLEKERKLEEARKVASTLPQFHLVVYPGETDEPSGTAERVGNTLLVGLGHKGRHVGVVGVFETGNPKKPYDLKYQLVALGPEFKTPEGKEADNPIMALM